MKCGPDECPIVAFSDLTPAEQRVERKRIAKKMSDQGFTEQQIAKQLGVSQNTISLDLSNLSIVDKLKPAKTASNPKGAGRPRGTGRTPKRGEAEKFKQAREIVRPRIEAGEALKTAKLEQEHGISRDTFERAALAEQARKEALADPTIERADLPLSAQQKLDAAIRQHKRKLDMEFEVRCREECRRWLNEVSLPQYLKEIDTLERFIRNREGIMDRTTYKKILACLHPDRVQDTALKNRYAEAFRLFTELEKRVLNEKESPTEFRKMPRTYEDLMAMKAKVQAERRAKRTNKSTMSVR